MVTEATEPVAPHEMSDPNLFLPGPSSHRPMTKINQRMEGETMPHEDAIQLEATLLSSTHETEPNTTLGPDHEPIPEPEPALQPTVEPPSGPELVPMSELEIQLEPEPAPQQEPEPLIVDEPFCDEEKKVIKPQASGLSTMFITKEPISGMWN